MSLYQNPFHEAGLDSSFAPSPAANTPPDSPPVTDVETASRPKSNFKRADSGTGRPVTSRTHATGTTPHVTHAQHQTSPLRLVVVGGVAGGLSFATRARRLSETSTITVFEKGPYVSYANCGIPYALGNVIADEKKLLLNSPESLWQRFRIDVKLSTEVLGWNTTRKVVYYRVEEDGEERDTEMPYDKLVLAQGADSFIPKLPGLQGDGVFTLQTIEDLQEIKKFLVENRCESAAVIGGGFIGIEAAENLKLLGLNVSVLEATDHVFPPLDWEMAQLVHDELRRHDINLVLNARIEGAESEPSRQVILPEGPAVDADVVIVAVGVRARTAQAKKAGLEVGETGVLVNYNMQTSDPDVYAVGDMVETVNIVSGQSKQLALAGPANRQGRLAADHVFGKSTEYWGNVGVSVCKVFDLTVASVGMSVGALRKIGQNPLWVTIHPLDHAGYYPGAHPLNLRVVFDRDTGLILGAQAVGANTVDKRIDVLSTAMHAGMSVFDLEHLELAYAPPYGSAKDPVNMAGFVASNVLRGDVDLVYAENLDFNFSELQVVDVRSSEEFARGHLKFAVNVPLDNLRENLDKIEKNKLVVVYCQVGYRGYLAYRILKQNGFDVVNLDGGFKTVSDAHYVPLIDGQTK